MDDYDLRFPTLSALDRAFSEVVSCPYVEDCLAEPRRLRLRFRGQPEPALRRLVARIRGLQDIPRVPVAPRR